MAIDVITPLSLLNRLLKSINGEKEGIFGEITSGVDSRLDNTLIVAAESIRGLEKQRYIPAIQSLLNGWRPSLVLFLL